MQQYSDVIQDQAGNALKGIAVSVMQAGRLATVYADSAGSVVAANPLTSAANGRFSFYAPAGDYDIWVAGQLQQTISLFGAPAANTLAASAAPPTSGTYAAGDFIPNTNITVLGPDTAQYVVDGWRCIAAGTPGTWMEIRLAVAPPPAALAPSPAPAPGAPAPAPTPAPSPATPYSVRIQAEDLSGVTLSTATAGYDGRGYVAGATGAGVTLGPASFAGVPAGTFTINIGYHNFSDQHNYVVIDGGAQTDYLFAATQTTPTPAWGVLPIPGVSFSAGTHTVGTVSNWGFTDWDYIELVQQVASSPAPAPAPPAPAPAPGSPPYVPFGARTDGAYPNGITVTGYTNAQKDALVQSCYGAWKTNRLKQAPAFTPSTGIYAGQAISDGYYVDAPLQITTGVNAATVSEAIGYGMLICVLMAGADTNAQAQFNGLFKVARGRPAYAMSAGAGASTYLMDWRLYQDFTSAGGGYNASDGDMDIALALLMAHRQWGSAGAINYHAEALNTINALKAANFAANGLPYYPGQDVSRTSDYMIGHFRAFKTATGDTFWDNARSNSLALLSSIISTYSATAKLPPGFIWQPLTNAAQPSPGGKIESSIEGYYDDNAIRDPLRLGVDFLFSGDASVKTPATNIVTFIKGNASGSAVQTCFGYKLDGTPLANLYYEPTQDACSMVGAMVDVAHQSWLNACFTQLTGNYNTTYFAAELTLLALLIASGNWWRP